MVSAIVSVSSGFRPGLTPGQGHCVAYLGKIRCSLFHLSTQMHKFNAGGNPVMDHHPIQEGVEIFPVVSCPRNRNEPRPNGLLGLYANFTFN